MPSTSENSTGFWRGPEGGLANYIDDKRLVVANFRGEQRECRLVTVLKGEIKPVVDGDSTRSLSSTAKRIPAVRTAPDLELHYVDSSLPTAPMSVFEKDKYQIAM